jgi:hypothetical protein
MIKVFTKRAFLESDFQVSVCGGDNPHINGYGGDSSHTLELPFLEKPQELGLKFLRDIADLVEKDRPALSQFKLSPLR